MSVCAERQNSNRTVQLLASKATDDATGGGNGDDACGDDEIFHEDAHEEQ